MANPKNWKVIREDEDVFKLFLDLIPPGIQLNGQRICKPCFSLLTIWKNDIEVDELLEESQNIKESITNKLKEVYDGQVRQTDSVPVRAKRRKKNMGACRSLQFLHHQQNHQLLL